MWTNLTNSVGAEEGVWMKVERSLSGSAIGLMAALAMTAAMITAGTAGADGPAGSRHHVIPATSPSTVTARPAAGHTVYPQSASYTQAPGDVTYQGGGVVTGPDPDPEPADLVSASASDNGTTLHFAAKTASLVDPASDPNWRNNSYIGWAIDPSFSGAPLYYAYFQLNSDGSPAGELTYAATDTPVSCMVTLAFDPTNGYQASIPAACLPGVTSFQWYAYSFYSIVGNAYGRAIPDPLTEGGKVFAPPIAAPPDTPPHAPGIDSGYLLVARDGGVFAFGASQFYGSLGGQHLNAPIVGGASTLDGRGYVMVASDGGVFAFGDARFYGSMGGKHLNAPIVAVAPLPTGTGYWLIASDGGVFSFGGARSYGSMGGSHLNAPIVAGASTPTGTGYWLVAADGGVFSFGDAAFNGSEGGVRLNRPIVNMAASGSGYLLVASDGGVFAFGGAPYFGSTATTPLNQPIEGLGTSADDEGYRMVASDGGIFSFGTAPYFGSMGNKPLNQPIVGMTSQG
jgi:hypothetical protein